MAADDAAGPSPRPNPELSDNGGRVPVDAAAPPRPPIEIDEALSQGWFEIWYQPKIDLKRKCLAGAEALARIRHPTLGILQPGAFLPRVTDMSIARLTQFAVVAALESWSDFEAAGFNLHVSVNVPVSVVPQLPIPALVERHRPGSDRWPGIILELTEEEIVRDPRTAHSIATQLRVNGITIALDDFGAGYSSFSSLCELAFAEIKIDRGFVRDCAADRSRAAICQTAIDLAHRFGSAAVGEGVYSQADLQALTAMGCDFGQGPLVAPPMSQDDFLGLLCQRISKPQPAAPPAKPGRGAELGAAGPRMVDRVARC